MRTAKAKERNKKKWIAEDHDWYINVSGSGLAIQETRIKKNMSTEVAEVGHGHALKMEENMRVISPIMGCEPSISRGIG